MLLAEQGIFSLPKVKVEGEFEDYAQDCLLDSLSKNPLEYVVDNAKNGIVTDFLNRYENREMSKQEREQGLQEIEKSLENEHKDEEIEGIIWHGKGGCDACPQEGEFFELDKLPETHPNCRCSTEVKYKKTRYNLI